MHPFSILTLGIFVAGYITARWDLVTRLIELAIFAWDHGVVTRTAKGAGVLSLFFVLFIIPAERIAAREAESSVEYPPVNSFEGAAHSKNYSKNGSMVKDDGLLRIFWPSDAPRTQNPGVIVGWRNSALDVVVVSILEHVEVRNVEKALQGGLLYRNSPHSIKRMFQLCSQPQMNVLGAINHKSKPTMFDPCHLCLQLDPQNWHPFVLCPPANRISVQVVVYRRPSPAKMQYMSLDPISLVLGDKAFGDATGDCELDTVRRQHLRQKLRLHTVTTHAPSDKENFLPSIIGQINCSRELDQLLLKNVHFIGARQKRTLSVSEMVVESASTVWDYLTNVLWLWAWPIILQTFKVGLICHRFIAEIILHILEWRPRAHSAALKDVSATAQQFDIRLQQFCYWPLQYTTLQRRKSDWFSVTDSHPDYIRFYNSLWLVANDVIIGIALGTYIIENADWVARSLNNLLSVWTVTGLERMIRWLNDWPAGLKLNNELASFLGDLFLWVIQYWSQCLDNIRPMLPALIYFVGFSSFAGASMPIALFSDLLSLLTLHIYSFYIASARIYHWQLTIIISLFHLFRGKKHNVLRNRIDSCDYDLDQLLLGTILFTLLAFLLPTVLVFYFAFALSRMIIITIMAILDTALACLNHFPLFALMLRIKDSRRLPGGVCFEIHDTPLPSTDAICVDDVALTSCVALKPVPLSLRQMFDQYFQLGGRIRQHYLSVSVMFYFATGQFVPPIDRRDLYSLQYSMLPARRPPIAEVWRRLN